MVTFTTEEGAILALEKSENGPHTTQLPPTTKSREEEEPVESVLKIGKVLTRDKTHTSVTNDRVFELENFPP